MRCKSGEANPPFENEYHTVNARQMTSGDLIVNHQALQAIVVWPCLPTLLKNILQERWKMGRHGTVVLKAVTVINKTRSPPIVLFQRNLN